MTEERSKIMDNLIAQDADLIELMASDAACYLYPGEDQQAERAAYARGCAAFARHRMEERAAIVAWLREQGEVHRSKWGVSIDLNIMRLTDAIEAGEHLK